MELISVCKSGIVFFLRLCPQPGIIVHRHLVLSGKTHDQRVAEQQSRAEKKESLKHPERGNRIPFSMWMGFLFFEHTRQSYLPLAAAMASACDFGIASFPNVMWHLTH